MESIIKKLYKRIINKSLNIAFVITYYFFNILNIKRPRILIYTDSRGFNVINKWGKIYFDSYIKQLMYNYRIKFFLCPEKYTTIVDFLNCINKIQIEKYQAVILHCGVVDFSPRPLSNIELVKQSKTNNPVFNSLFEANKAYYANPYDTLYKSEPTINLYSEEYLNNYIIPKLLAIKNLIWINSNPLLTNWDGNYAGGRPANINNLVNHFDEILGSKLTNVIDLKAWDAAKIKNNTIDNIHFTNLGFLEIQSQINQRITELLASKKL